MPLYRQLELELPSNLGTKRAHDLDAMRAQLKKRVDACSAVLAQYEALGQAPPPTFRTWSTELLRERDANMTAKAELLRNVVKLDAQLGRTKMDWELPVWTTERLEEHAAALQQQVSALAAHKEKQVLLGKVEAALWMRREEAPIALSTMSTPQLRALLQELKASFTPSMAAFATAASEAASSGDDEER